MKVPPPHTGPENDYRPVAERAPVGSPKVAVVIPAYERAGALARTLAGIARQTVGLDRLDVVVVDDGSQSDLGTAITDSGLTSARLVRQERSGFGAGRARNRGIAETDAEIVMFLDSDCIPDSDLIERHLWWHERASNLMVTSPRRHVDAETTAATDIATGARLPGDLPTREGDHGLPADWRRAFVRRGGRLTLGDTAFRAAITNNLSVRRVWLERVGGFDEAFAAWGGEDTELAWRLWNEGLFVVPVEESMVHHQVAEGEDRSWRDASRRSGLRLVADRVPHRFYRQAPTPFASVPKVSWVVGVSTGEEADRAWRTLSATGFGDAEIVFHGPEHALSDYLAVRAHSTGTVVVTEGGPATAVEAARGEYVALVHARARFSPGLIGKIVDRLDADRRVSMVRCPYAADGGDTYRRLDDLLAVDRVVGAQRGPLFAVLARREVMKDPSRLETPDGWADIVDTCRLEFLPGDPIRIPIDVDVSVTRSLGLQELASTDPRELARIALRKARARSVATKGVLTEAPPKSGSDLVGIDYIGFTEHFNLGDDAVLLGVQRLMPWARIGRDMADADLLMVGGGTLVNGKRYYLNRVLRNDSPTIERAVFGVGVRDPAFHGLTEPMDEWWRFFDSSLLVSVRGPASVDHLRALGYRGDVEVIGDPALVLEPSAGVERNGDLVVVCPVWTSGDLVGGDDASVFDAIAALLRHLIGVGKQVVMLSAFPQDDRHIIGLMRAAGAPDLEYVAGYVDVDATVDLLASASLVVAERLHAAILAAAGGTPFVGLEYWPKHRDFARSIDVEDLVIPTAGITSDQLITAVEAVSARDREVTERITAGVGELRRRQREAADRLEHVLRRQ